MGEIIGFSCVESNCSSRMAVGSAVVKLGFPVPFVSSVFLGCISYVCTNPYVLGLSPKRVMAMNEKEADATQCSTE